MNQSIIVLCGGISVERDVSLRSGQAVFQALKDAGFRNVQLIDIKDKQQVNHLPVDAIVLPILHGTYGEDGEVQQQMERRGMRFFGSNSKVSQICFDKELTIEAYQKAGLPTARGKICTKAEYLHNELRQKPHVLKVARGGSSIGTLLVRDPTKDLKKEIDELFELDDKAVLEELVTGIEVTVPVLGVEPLPVVEIVPPKDGEFDYENKYNGKSQEICPAKSISAVEQRELQDLALKAHLTLGCRHISRTDMIVRNDGGVVLLETNTMPGLNKVSLLPLSAQVAGMGMPELVTKFVEMTERDYS